MFLVPGPIFPDATLLVDLGLARVDIRRRRIHPLGAFHHLPEGEHDDKEGQSKVRGDEPLGIKRLEHGIPVEERRAKAQDHRHDGHVRLQRRDPGQVALAIDSLGAQGAVPAEEGTGHAGVGEHQADGGQVDEPVEDVDGGVVGDQEGDARQQRDRQHTVDGDAVLGALGQELGRLAVAGERIQRAAGAVQVGVPAGPAREQDQHVDEIRQDGDAQVLDPDDPGRRGGPGRAFFDRGHEPRIVRVTDDADAEHADDVEADDAPEGHLHDARDGAARVLDLARGERGQIRAGDGEGRIDHDREKAQEAPGGAIGVVFVHDAVGPVAEAVDIVFGVAADHGDEGEEDEAQEEEDFGRGHDEFGFAVVLDGDEVQREADDHGHGDPGRWVDVDLPVVHDEGDGGVFGADEHQPGVEIDPSPRQIFMVSACPPGTEEKKKKKKKGTAEGALHGESKRRVDVSRRQLKDRPADGQVGAHFADAEVDGENERDAPDQIAQQQREWACVAQVGADAHKQARSNRATNGHQLDMARRQTTLGLGKGNDAAGVCILAIVEDRLFLHGRQHIPVDNRLWTIMKER